MKTLKIGYFSDLHTEFLRPKILLTPKDLRLGRLYSLEDFAAELADAYAHVDVIVAAGDIGTGVSAVGFLKLAFPEKPVIYVTGNHDYWGGEIYSTHRKIADACKDEGSSDSGGSNIHYLQGGDTIEIEGVLFCGATLWTDYLLTDSVYAIDIALDTMNDFRRIRIRRNSAVYLNKQEAPSKLKPQHLLGFHRQHLTRIKQVMQQAQLDDKVLVVVTHHAPSAQSLWFDNERAAMQGIRLSGYEKSDPSYASHLDHLMQGEDAPQYWIHGHTHVSVNYRIGNTQVVSNPKGYAEGDDTAWVAGRYIKVPL